MPIDLGECSTCGWTCPDCGCCKCNGCGVCYVCYYSECECVCDEDADPWWDDPMDGFGSETSRG